MIKSNSMEMRINRRVTAHPVYVVSENSASKRGQKNCARSFLQSNELAKYFVLIWIYCGIDLYFKSFFLFWGFMTWEDKTAFSKHERLTNLNGWRTSEKDMGEHLLWMCVSI